MNCKNKTILITGASSGIGKACATLFAQSGATLILTARRSESLQQLAQDLQQQYQTRVHTFACDVRDADALQNGIAQLPPEFQSINVLINNAGLALGLDKLHEGSPDDWAQMIDTNIKGVLHATRAILPGMLARNDGHIIFLGSTAGHQTYLGGNVYCATKSAVHALCKAFAQEIAGTPLRMTEIDPGMVETPFSEVRFKGDKTRAKKVYENVTALSAEDIADTILYAISRPKHVNIAQILLYSTDQPLATRPG